MSSTTPDSERGVFRTMVTWSYRIFVKLPKPVQRTLFSIAEVVALVLITPPVAVGLLVCLMIGLVSCASVPTRNSVPLSETVQQRCPRPALPDVNPESIVDLESTTSALIETEEYGLRMEIALTTCDSRRQEVVDTIRAFNRVNQDRASFWSRLRRGFQ